MLLGGTASEDGGKCVVDPSWCQALSPTGVHLSAQCRAGTLNAAAERLELLSLSTITCHMIGTGFEEG